MCLRENAPKRSTLPANAPLKEPHVPEQLPGGGAFDVSRRSRDTSER